MDNIIVITDNAEVRSTPVHTHTYTRVWEIVPLWPQPYLDNDVDFIFKVEQCWLTREPIKSIRVVSISNVVSEVQRELDGFRYSKCQNQDDGKVSRVLNASTYHEYNKLACHVFDEYKDWHRYDFVKK